MARRADQRNDLRRKKRHRGLKLSPEQRNRGTQLSPERRRWKTGVLVISGIFFLAGILIVLVPMATMATMVPGTHHHCGEFMEYSILAGTETERK